MKTLQWKKVGGWVLALSLLAAQVLLRNTAHAAESNPGWKHVYAKNGECRIAFPSQPQLMQQSLNIGETGQKLFYDVYLAPLEDKAVCLLLVATYPSKVPSGQEMTGLEGLIRGIVGHHPENELMFAEVTEHKGGYPVVNFLVQNKTSYFRGQAMMVGTRLFLMAMEGKKGSLHEPTFSGFSGSFQLLAE